MKSIYYLFYRIYRFQIKIIGEEKSTAANSAFLSVAMFCNLNLFTIFILLDKRLNLLDIFDTRIPNADIVVPGVVLTITGVCCYFLFYYNSKYLKIISEIENQVKSENRKLNTIAIGYQILSFVALTIALIYRFS